MHHRSLFAIVALFVAFAGTGCPEATCENDFDCAAGEVCGVDDVCEERVVSPAVEPSDEPPETTLDSEPNAIGNDASPTVTFSCDRASCTYQCSLDDAAFSDCTSPHTEADIPDGAHTFRVRAIANELVDGTPAEAAFEIDTVAPALSLDEQPPALTEIRSATIAFSCADTCTFRCALDLDATQAQPCTSPFTIADVTEAAHVFVVVAEDEAGNTTELNAAWTVDATAPVIVIDAAPADPSGPNTTVLFSADESAVSFACSLDDGPSLPCTSPHDIADLADGPHTLRINADDETGNSALPIDVSWTVDATPPSVVVSESPQNPSREVSASFSFGCNEAPCAFECALDGEDFGICSSPSDLDGLAIGSHSFQIRATDAVGNASSPTTVQWSIERVYVSFIPGEVGIANDGTLWCFDDGTYCGLRIDFSDPPAPLDQPLQFGNKKNWVAAASVGYGHTGIDSDGHAFAWGIGAGGIFGQADSAGFSVATQIPGLVDVTSITLEYLHGCAISGGRPYCWGFTGGGLVGGVSNVVVPTLVQGTAGFTATQIASSDFTDYALDDSGRLYRWGRRGPTGTHTVDDSAVLEEVGPVSALWVSFRNMCMLREGDGFFCGLAQLDTLDDLAFVDVEGNWKSMIMTTDFGCGIRLDDTVQCWPDNDFSARIDRGLTNVVELRSDQSFHTCARTGDGRLHCWADHLGFDGPITTHSAPQTPAAE